MPSTKPSYVEELEQKVMRMEVSFQEKIGLLEAETARSRLRLLGDLEKRFADREEALLLDVLELMDDLDRACALTAESPAVKQGLDLVAQRAARFLEKRGCEHYAPQGEPFDPTSMEAVQMLPGERDTVVAVYQPGIRREGRLLRPARVAVGTGVAQEPPAGHGA
jgi:molecular chaperone GrpE (heat shock protein)